MTSHATRSVILFLTAICIQGCSRPTAGDANQTNSGSAKPSVDSALENYKNRSREFPADFPLPKYPHAEVEASQLNPGRKGRPSSTVMLKTKDDINLVFRFYAQSLKESGWDIAILSKNNGFIVMNATRDGKEANIMITQTRGGLTAVALYAKKQKHFDDR